VATGRAATWRCGYTRRAGAARIETHGAGCGQVGRWGGGQVGSAVAALCVSAAVWSWLTGLHVAARLHAGCRGSLGAWPCAAMCGLGRALLCCWGQAGVTRVGAAVQAARQLRVFVAWHAGMLHASAFALNTCWHRRWWLLAPVVGRCSFDAMSWSHGAIQEKSCARWLHWWHDVPHHIQA
jgi:hypothetical protein